jgi:ketosteroid isomerase-like protein
MSTDLAWFEDNWTEDAIYVHMSGGVDGRAEFIERLRSRATVYHSRETGDVIIRQYGDTAIVTGWSKIKIVVSGTEKDLDTRFSRVYMRVNGRWLLANSQSGANTARKS